MSVDELRQIKDLKLHYVQMETYHKCMPLGGPLGYDTSFFYTFVNLFGYGQTGFLRTILRDEESMLEIDFKEDLSRLGSSGDGIWSHTKHKIYLLYETLRDLSCMLFLVVITCKVFLHSLARLQTKQFFARSVSQELANQMQ